MHFLLFILNLEILELFSVFPHFRQKDGMGLLGKGVFWATPI